MYQEPLLLHALLMPGGVIGPDNASALVRDFSRYFSAPMAKILRCFELSAIVILFIAGLEITPGNLEPEITKRPKNIRLICCVASGCCVTVNC